MALSLHYSLQGRRRRYGLSGCRTTFLANKGFSRTTFLFEYAFLVGSCFQFPRDFSMR